MTRLDDNWHRVLVLAPIGRDGRATAELLARVGVATETCTNLSALMSNLDVGAAAVFVAEEALVGNDVTRLSSWIARQPPWSDLPFVILTSHQAQAPVVAWRQRIVAALRNVSLLERPVQAITLSSTIQSSLRARLRQYEVRALLDAQTRTAEALEAQVAERTVSLEEANALLRSQMAERAEVEEILRQSQKMEAIGQLTGGLAHDFNNLLAGISGSLELMRARIQQGGTSDVDRYIGLAQGATKRAAALTHRLLAFSRRQTLDPKPTNVNELVSGFQEIIQRTVGPVIAFEFIGASNIWAVLVDPPQLENALLNLCINARDAMPDGGRVTVTTANTLLDEADARQLDLPSGQYLALSVMDTGTGMSPEVIEHVFEPFYTTKPLGEGTGLGLSMIYGFARQSGGHVRIESAVGKGTTVSIYLPRHHGEIEPDTGLPQAFSLPRSEQGETVLVVDDEPTVRMLVTDILNDLGYSAIEASESAAGLKILQSDVRIDLLVTDVGLPGGMNGRQMADAARVFRPDLKVLFITGYAETSVVGDGHLTAGMAVLTKPFSVEIMASRIRQMIEERHL